MRLEGVTVWDGDRLVGAADVTLDGDRVAEVAPVPGPRADGLALIPGLVDTHVHLTDPAVPGDYTTFTWPLVTPVADRTLHALANARAALESGVTTMRDMASDERPIALRRAFDAGLVAGPRVLAYGVVNMTAGHHDMFTPAGAPVRPETADGPDACRALVRKHARAGVDGIKMMTSGGVLSTGDRSGWRNYTAAEIAAITDEAHALGLPVAAHAHSEAGIAAALDGGADSLEHATLISEEQARAAAARGVTAAPTLLINDRIADGSAGATAESRDKAAALVAARDAKLRRAADLGVRFVLGTDCNATINPFGAAMPELARMRDVLGYDDEQALRAGTSDAADALGLGDRVGRITPGRAADLLLVRGRPWADITDLTAANLVAVISRGTLAYGTLS
ncbi:MAG TPA: amidohydrolase family protein [Streptosporangiaceae bacterium]